jgi:riboflavin kinase/FMN adenylyltransferase
VKIVFEGDPVPDRSGSVVTVGVFDGVHAGHRALISEARRIATDDGLQSVVVTFDRHPATVVRPDEVPRLLTSLHHRLELLEQLGVDMAYVVTFDEERSLQTPEQFVEDVLVDRLGTKVAVAAESFHFGHRRKGDVPAMTELGVQYDIKVVTVPLTIDEAIGGPVTSTAVRGVVAGGDVELAAKLLGRPFEVRGIVEHGDARGRTIGFPTANGAVAGDIILPSDGVYAGWYVRGDGSDGTLHPSAINVGRRPTFYDENGLLLVEAHLIDFDGDLYGEKAAVRFVTRLRDEQRFSGIDALAAQLRSDVDAARAVLRDRSA